MAGLRNGVVVLDVAPQLLVRPSMALDFISRTSETYVNHGSDASLDDVTIGSYMVWVYLDGAPTSDNPICNKGVATSTGGIGMEVKATYRFGMSAARVTTWMTAQSNDNEITANKWWCLAGIYDITGTVDADQKIFKGSENEAMAEVGSYAVQSAGSGARNSNSGEDFCTSAFSPTNWTWSGIDGKVASVFHWNVRLTVDDLEKQRRCTEPVVYMDNCILACDYINNTERQLDKSRYGNHGLVTGALEVLGPSLEQLRPFFPLTEFSYAPMAAIYGERGVGRGIGRGIYRGV